MADSGAHHLVQQPRHHYRHRGNRGIGDGDHRNIPAAWPCVGLLTLVLLLTPACWAAAVQPRTQSQAMPHTPAQVNPELRAALTTAVAKSRDFPNRFAAEVWLKDMSTRLSSQMMDIKRRLQLLRLVHAEARRADLSPNLVLAVIQVESAFKRYALSPAGARGLMQVMPFWVDEIGRPHDNLFDMQTNLRYGCTILAFYLQKEHGNISRALARYNGSLGKYGYPARVQRALRKRWYKR